jgi:hypothetical protein
MNELAEALTGESAHAAPAHILQALSDDSVHQVIPGATHTIYEELWHIVFWQRMTINWISGLETEYPKRPTDPFPTAAQAASEPWPQLCRRFLDDAESAAVAAADPIHIEKVVRCPSRPGLPVRLMTVRDQLISLAAHNAYHFGRIVLLRQITGCWPPPLGGFTW